MRLSHIAIIVLVAFTLKGKVGLSEAVPTHQDKFITPITITLFSADALLRTVDGLSTVHNLGDKCKCFKEINPIAPHSDSALKQAAFQAGMLATVYGAAWTFHHYHHDKIASTIMMLDIGSEAFAVQGNMRAVSNNSRTIGKPLTNKTTIR